jgi:hypothetical protein
MVGLPVSQQPLVIAFEETLGLLGSTVTSATRTSSYGCCQTLRCPSTAVVKLLALSPSLPLGTQP